ncbi:MAG: hypothetical protein PHD26_02390 [Methanosarcinaceae archaeon]|nr:hypothetical protein [Methanosarcinaceae archaeon]
MDSFSKKGRGTRNKGLKLAGWLSLILVIFFGLFAAFWSFQSEKSYKESLRSDYKYEVSFRSSSKLQNASFYLPIPVFENESKKLLLSAEDFYGQPPDWNFSFEETKHGPMLKLEAKNIQSVFHSLPKPLSENEELEKKEVSKPDSETFKEAYEYSEETPVSLPFNFGARLKVEPLLNTQNPKGKEALLSPKYGLKLSDNDQIVSHSKEINPQFYYYESRIYAKYETSAETLVEIDVSFRGSNSWWTFGWAGNEYKDRVFVKLRGAQEGWIPVEGSLITADGNYRD